MNVNTFDVILKFNFSTQITHNIKPKYELDITKLLLSESTKYESITDYTTQSMVFQNISWIGPYNRANNLIQDYIIMNTYVIYRWGYCIIFLWKSISIFWEIRWNFSTYIVKNIKHHSNIMEDLVNETCSSTELIIILFIGFVSNYCILLEWCFLNIM